MEEDAPVEQGGADSGFLRKNIKTKVTLRRNDLAGTARIGPTKAVYPGRGGKRGNVTFKTRTGRVINFISSHAGATKAAMVRQVLGVRHAQDGGASVDDESVGGAERKGVPAHRRQAERDSEIELNLTIIAATARQWVSFEFQLIDVGF
jgi:hypothetical protein